MADYGTNPAKATLPIRPFEAHADEAKLQDFVDLLRLSPVVPAAFENTSAGRRYGVTRDWLSRAKQTWLEDFNWRTQEARINSFPNFKTSVEDAEGNAIELQFLALFSRNPEAVPIMFLHGWPGSICEFLDILDLLRSRYTPDSLPYHIIVPSLPGYAYSSVLPLETEYTIGLAASALNALMVGLGFGVSGYLVQGGDLGSLLARVIALQYESCKGVHVNMMTIPAFDGDEQGTKMDALEESVMKKAADFIDTGFGWAFEQGTRSATVGAVLCSSPLALLSWVGEKFLEWTDQDPPLEKILEGVTLYWMTDTMSRCFYHNRGMGDPTEKPGIMRMSMLTSNAKAVQMPYIDKPCGYSLFAHEILPIPESWAKRNCDLISFKQHEHGGHFAAMERPEELLADVEDYVRDMWKAM